ncbi:MAG: glutamine amidotransferase [Thermogutta sp.]
MKQRICYLGDDDLSAAAAYLAGVMGFAGLPYDHIPSRQRAKSEILDHPYSLYILSDYPSAGFSGDQMHRLAENVAGGSGLLMIGGWESYFGRVGEYANRPIADVLPVYLASSDDRVNCPQGCYVRRVCRHPVTEGLPWQAPPVIAGFNRITPKPESKILLVGDCVWVTDDGKGLQFSSVDEVPLLVVGKHGQGRVAALAFDVAPHWIGGMVDWGTRRIVQQIPVGGFVEIGDNYAQFFRQLIVWTGQFEDLPESYPEEITQPETETVTSRKSSR